MAYEKAATAKAIDKYAEARDLWRDLGDHGKAAIAAERLGAAYQQLGELDRAAESYGEAIALARKSGDGLLESELQATLGWIQAFLGNDETALESAEALCRTALDLAEEMGNDAGRADALHCFGEASYSRGKPTKALIRYGQAESIQRQIGDRAGLARSLLSLGFSHSDLGSFELAEAHYDEALAIWRSTGNQRGAGRVLLAIARMHQRRAQFQSALDRFYETAELFERMGDAIHLASSYEGIASVYMKMGQYRNAARFWNLAVRSYEEARLYHYVPHLLEDLGLAKLALGDSVSAMHHFDRALTLSWQSGNELNHAYALRLLAYANYAFDKPRIALEYLLDLMALEETGQNPPLRADALGDIGFVYSVLGEREKATGSFEQALHLYEAASNLTGKVRTLFGLAKVQDELGNLELARHSLETALEIIESLRSDVVLHEMRASYAASVHDYYRLHVDLLMRAHAERRGEGLDRTAFRASERARARSLLDHLAATGVDLRQSADKHLIAEEDRLRRLLDEHYRQQAIQGEETHPEGTPLSEEARDLEARYEQVRAKMRASSPQHDALTSPQPVALADVQSEILDGDTALLEYSLGNERSYLFVVTSDAFLVHTLPGRGAIDELARRTYSLAAQPPANRAAGERYWDTAARLSEMILGPAMAQIDDKRLVVVADGALRYVPFAALPKPGSRGARPPPMIEDHEIALLPSASALAVLRDQTRDRPTPSKTLAMFADPVFSDSDPRLAPGIPSNTLALNGGARAGHGLSSDLDLAKDPTRSVTTEGGPESNETLRGSSMNLARLPHTAREADRIQAIVPEGDFLARVGFGASRAAALDPALGDYRIIHFATHARFDETEPGLSGLIFSGFDRQGRARDGFVRLHDIYDLRLPAELVVLSACDTALGKDIEGEGLVGIVRGFMYAGSKRVVASFWQVADAATAELMNRFYLEMFGHGLAPPAALRKAQLHVMRQPRWRHPFYWAAFSLQGEWLPD